jgi:hemolysin activation/secretion protein
MLARSEDATISLLGKKLRTRPDLQGRPPQWDLILRAFVDAGWTHANSRLSYESNESLSSVGVGAGLVVDRHLDMRVDVGIPLAPVDSGTADVDAGDVRVHFSLGLSY